MKLLVAVVRFLECHIARISDTQLENQPPRGPRAYFKFACATGRFRCAAVSVARSATSIQSRLMTLICPSMTSRVGPVDRPYVAAAPRQVSVQFRSCRAQHTCSPGYQTSPARQSHISSAEVSRPITAGKTNIVSSSSGVRVDPVGVSTDVGPCQGNQPRPA
jgi:hypothetical protein